MSRDEAGHILDCLMTLPAHAIEHGQGLLCSRRNLSTPLGHAAKKIGVVLPRSREAWKMPGACRDGLSRVAVRRFGRELQLSVDLIQQLFRLLSMALHVPLIGFLGGDNSFPGLLTQPLCGRKIWMSSGRDVSDGPLRRGGRSNQEQGAENRGENSSSDHGGHCTLRPEVRATQRITPGERHKSDRFEKMLKSGRRGTLFDRSLTVAARKRLGSAARKRDP